MSEVTADEASVSSAPDRREPHAAAIDAVLRRLSAFWTGEKPGVPAWAVQELTFGQLRLLFQLQAHGGAAPMSRIAEWLAVGLPAASGVVDRVERHGLVERRHRDDDRRIVECCLTGQGADLLAEIVGTRDQAMRRILGVLTADELADLDHLLVVVQQRLQARAGDGDPGITPDSESRPQ